MRLLTLGMLNILLLSERLVCRSWSFSKTNDTLGKTKANDSISLRIDSKVRWAEGCDSRRIGSYK